MNYINFRNLTNKHIFTRMLQKSGFIWLLFVFDIATHVIKHFHLYTGSACDKCFSILAKCDHSGTETTVSPKRRRGCGGSDKLGCRKWGKPQEIKFLNN